MPGTTSRSSNPCQRCFGPASQPDAGSFISILGLGPDDLTGKGKNSSFFAFPCIDGDPRLSASFFEKPLPIQAMPYGHLR